MFKTFKGSIETQIEDDILKKGDVFFFNPNNRYTYEDIILNIKHELFEFSKEDVIFSKKQKDKYKDYLLLHPIHGVGKTFSDGVKYTLHRRHEKGETKYQIEVDGIKAELKLNWYNRQKIEWVQGRKINWTKWQVTAAFTACAVAATVGYFIYNKPIQQQPNTDTLKTSKQNQLPFRGVDTTKKSDILKNLDIYDSTKQ